MNTKGFFDFEGFEEPTEDNIQTRLGNPGSLLKFMKHYYKSDPHEAVDLLNDQTFVHKNGWRTVFHEGCGEGVWSPKEGIVATFDVDDLDNYNTVQIYKYDQNAWKPTDVRGGWDRIYNGDNGEDYDVEYVTSF